MTAWMDDAACAEVAPDLWFPALGDSSADARKICASCPVTAECLEYAIGEGITHGVFGGLNSRTRLKLMRRTP